MARTRTEGKRAELLEAATAVFLEQGFERTLMSDICEKAKCSKSTLYSYFASKEDIFFEVVIGGTAQEGAELFMNLDGLGDCFEERLYEFGRRYLLNLYSPRFMALRRLIFADTSNLSIGRTIYENGIQRYEHFIVEFLAKAMDSGSLRTADPAIAVSHLCGLLESELLPRFLLRALDNISRTDLELVAQRAVESFLAAYRPSIHCSLS